MIDYEPSSDDNLSKSEIDEQILFSEKQSNYHTERARHLKKRWNKITPSGRLTDEILVRIFAMLSHDPARIEDRWDSTVVAQVCHRWRIVAMGSGEVWSNIIFRIESFPRRKLENQLKLSQKVDLTIFILQTKFLLVNSIDNLKKFIGAVSPHSERIKDLHAHVTGYAWRTACTLKAPNLNIFDIQLESSLSVLDKVFPMDSMKKARFEKLCLDQTLFCSVSQMNNLRDLSFQYVSFTSAQLPNLLQSCPMLEHLALLRCRTENAIWPSDKIHLDYLTDLSLRYMDMGEISRHMGYLVLPVHLNLTIECNDNRNFSETFAEVNFGIASEDLYCESLNVALFFNEMWFEATCKPIEDHDDVDTKVFKICIIISWNSKEHTPTVFQKACEFISKSCMKNASNVQIELEVDKEEFVSEEMWVRFLGALDDTSSLAVGFTGYCIRTEEEFFKALRRGSSVATYGYTKRVCRNLEEISLHYIKCSVDAILELEHSLRSRKLHNIPIEKLSMKNVIVIPSEFCDLSLVHDLSRSVQSFDWNGSKYPFYNLELRKVSRLVRRMEIDSILGSEGHDLPRRPSLD